MVENTSFDQAAKLVETNVGRFTDQQKLDLYGYFKQAKVGNVNTDRPGMFDLKGKAKWDAWSNKKGTSQADAAAAYVKLVKDVLTIEAKDL